MTSTSQLTQADEWLDYYARFSYFSPEKIREGCHPRIKEHRQAAHKAIVLVHGLSDSPYYMTAIGDYFFTNLGYNVYLPLLQGHGLKKPAGMEGIELEEWKSNVSFAINCAASRANEISIGGLSTGGTLSLFMAAVNPKINGSLYLFSAALDLAGGPLGLIGEIKEKLLQTFLPGLLDFNKPLIDENPYRYSHVDMDGAAELARLIKETDVLIDGFSDKFPFPKKVFAAHSDCDTTASQEGIHALENVVPEEQFTFFRVWETEEQKVKHASVVLKEPIKVGEDTLEEANPVFDDMMTSIASFEKQ